MSNKIAAPDAHKVSHAYQDTNNVPSRIRALPDIVANQIAAGEVVERPASVIKELIENSIDAGALSVTVSFRNGGKSLIEVIDDGHGMGRDDAILAFERHATSKIQDVADLKAVATLGFRGEALPSIASVSRLSLTTCPGGGETGVEVIIEGGKLKDVRDAPPIPGTRTQVRSLFFNVPARRKFLRSESVEAAHCHEAAVREALGRPDRGFTLLRDGKAVFEARPESGGEIDRRIAALFGGKILEQITPVECAYAGMTLSGYVSRPGVTRAGRDLQYVFINGRYVRDRLVGKALADGYRSLLPRGRFPMIFLWLTIPPDRVDVNVSPTKTEVRFVDAGSMFHLVKSGVADALQAPGGRERPGFAPSGVGLRRDFAGPAAVAKTREFYEPVAALDTSEKTDTAPQAAPAQAEPAQAELLHFDTAIPDTFVAVGQVFKSFILIEDGDRLLLIDQHTAHERVNYERLTLRYREGRIDSQELLFPVQLELTARDADLMRRAVTQFERLGFFLDHFGENSFVLRAAPSLLLETDHQAVILDIIDTVARDGLGASLDAVGEAAINIMACRGAVKAGQTLDREEIRNLVESLKRCRLPFTCPHGRPVALTLEKKDLLKGFLRK